MFWKQKYFTIAKQQLHSPSPSSYFEWTKRWTASPAKQHQASQDALSMTGCSLANHGTALPPIQSHPPMKRRQEPRWVVGDRQETRAGGQPRQKTVGDVRTGRGYLSLTGKTYQVQNRDSWDSILLLKKKKRIESKRGGRQGGRREGKGKYPNTEKEGVEEISIKLSQQKEEGRQEEKLRSKTVEIKEVRERTE